MSTFHERCHEAARLRGETPDFSQPGVFEQLSTAYADWMASTESAQARWDLLIIDEMQDFEPAWVEALLHGLKPEGRLYLLGDPDQSIYPREAFELPEAVQIESMENYRSPRRLVQTINQLQLSREPVQARSSHAGDSPAFAVYRSNHPESLIREVEAAIKAMLAQGLAPEQIVVLSFGGQKSALLQRTQLAGLPCKRFTGQYDAAGNAVWTEGDLLVETLYRYKSQCAPGEPPRVLRRLVGLSAHAISRGWSASWR